MTNQTIISLELTEQEQQKLYSLFREFQSTKTPPYALWQLRPENCVITCYQSGKTVFQGKDAHIYSSHIQLIEQKDIENINSQFPQAGSDEVGTGDYFGPVCVCACIVHEKDISFLKELSVQDSKALSDKEILKIAPSLMNRLTHSLLVLDNRKYNQVHKHSNMNEIKAKMHNKAYINLKQKEQLPELIVVDQFAEKNLYYRYLRKELEIIDHIHFETKAEDKYLSVASASIIARYAFLKSMESLETYYSISLPKGAGLLVDEAAKSFAEKYGFEELQNVAKIHFKNTEKVKK